MRLENTSNLIQQGDEPLDLSVVPYLKSLPHDGRLVLVTTYFDTEQKTWKSFLKQKGKLEPFGFNKLVTGIYVAKGPADPEMDLHLNLTEVAFQYFGLPDLQKLNRDIRHDITNALGSIQKYFILLNHVNAAKSLMDAKLMTTEIEYALTNHRSFYDLLNRVVAAVFKHSKPASNQLPDSFRAVAEKTTEDVERKFRLPKPIAEFYKTREALFTILRDARDDIVHHGESPSSIFHFEDGFGYAIDRGAFSKLRSFGLWPDSRIRHDNMGSLLELFAFLVEDMLAAANALSESLCRSFEPLPKPIAPDFHVYFCSELNFHFARLSHYRATPWMSPSIGFRPGII